jgi:hypothetical protein
MGKVIAWFLKFTKVGKAVTPVQRFISGKKSYLAGAALAVPAAAAIALNFSDRGIAYLTELPGTDEFRRLMEGIGIMGLRAAITKAAAPEKDPNAEVG